MQAYGNIELSDNFWEACENVVHRKQFFGIILILYLLLSYRRHLPSKRISLPPLSSPMMEGLLTPSEISAARRKCTIVEEDEEEEVELVKPAAVCDDSGLKTMSRSSSTDYPAATLDLASVLFSAGTKPLLPPDASEPIEPTPAPFPQSSQIGTGLSRQNSLRRSETSGSNSGAASPTTTPPGSTPSSSQGSPARYKLGSGRKLANTRSSPQLILNQIHEEAEEGGAQSHIDPVLDNFPQTSAGAVVIRRLEQRRKLRLHKSRTTSCSSSDASDDENAGSETRDSKRHPRPEKTPTPPPIGKEPHDDSSDSNQDPGASTANNPSTSMASLTLSSRSRSRTNESNTPQTGKGPSNDEHSEGGSGDAPHVLSSRRNRSHLQQARVRQSRSLNRISELHVVADFSENEDMLTRYLDSVNVNRGATRSRDDSLTSSDGEFDGQSQPNSQQSQRRTKVNLRLLEQRLNKIQEESLHNLKNDDENGKVAEDPDEEAGGTDGDVSDNVSTVADDFSAPPLPLLSHNPTMTKSILIEDKENQTTCLSETTSVKSCVVTTSGSSNKKPQHPRLNRAHSCGSLFSLKERALLRKKLSSHVTAAFLDILSNSTNASEVVTEVNKKQQTDLTLALKTNPLAVFQLQSSRCCNLC